MDTGVKIREYSQEELEAALKNAYSQENMEGHDCGHLRTRIIGTVKRGNRLYDVSEDSAGHYWYAVRVITDKGIVSEYEAIFGRKPKESRKRKRKAK